VSGKEMLVRVSYALDNVRKSTITPKQFAVYIQKVASSYLELGSDDPTLVSGPQELGEAPRDWDVDGDFTPRDEVELSAGDDLEAPRDHHID